MLAITRDVSESKAAAERMAAATEAMRLSEERYHTVFETSLDGITISRMRDGNYIDVNNSFLNLLGIGAMRSSGEPPMKSESGSTRAIVIT